MSNTPRYLEPITNHVEINGETAEQMSEKVACWVKQQKRRVWNPTRTISVCLCSTYVADALANSIVSTKANELHKWIWSLRPLVEFSREESPEAPDVFHMKFHCQSLNILHSFLNKIIAIMRPEEFCVSLGD
jgi:hypothetical protein